MTSSGIFLGKDSIKGIGSTVRGKLKINNHGKKTGDIKGSHELGELVIVLESDSQKD